MSNYIPCHRKLCTTFSKSFSSCSSRSALFKMYGVVVPFLQLFLILTNTNNNNNKNHKKNPTNSIALLDWSNIVEVNLAQDNKKGKKRSIALLGNVHIVVKRKKMQATTKKQNKVQLLQNCFFVLLLEKKSHLSVSI
ncbi:hypothetical protein T05_13442 [Trichinella murrelli]|uniref:Uncharacterized protein n=1 Tax=Trichinella murrelli TaxID=144512 RepID=A0A0V0TLZ2_9BILA|nr:hypothetical protein T05_13442 [Trichinella murrelli]